MFHDQIMNCESVLMILNSEYALQTLFHTGVHRNLDGRRKLCMTNVSTNMFADFASRIWIQRYRHLVLHVFAMLVLIPRA